MTQCKGIDSIIISRKSYKGPAVQTGFHLSEHCSELFEGKLTSEMIRRRWIFMLRTAASQNPLKWGAWPGMNFHRIRCVEQNSDTTFCVFCWVRNSNSSFSSREAPTKFFPLSLQRKVGFPRRATNLLREAMNVAVVRSDTTLMWMAFTDKETNRHRRW